MLHLAILGNASNYHLRRWLPALADQGIRVSLASFVEPAADLAGVDFHRIERPTKGMLPHGLLDFLTATSRARRLLKDLEPDVVMGSYATNYGFLAARTGFHPFVLQTWTADVQLYPKVGAKRFILAPMVRKALKTADLVTTDGPALKTEVLTSFPFTEGKVHSILWGIELDEYVRLDKRRSSARAALEVPDSAVVVTIARGLRFHDRPDVSLPAISHVLETRPEVHAIVLTLGHPVTDGIRPHIDALEANPRCHVVDRFLDRTHIQDVWAASDFVVSVPLFDGISEALLEAMAAGCIPIVSDIPPNRVIVPDARNAIFSRADSSDTLAADIGRGIDQLTRFQEAAVPANRAWVRENASVEQAAASLATLLKDLIKQ